MQAPHFAYNTGHINYPARQAAGMTIVMIFRSMTREMARAQIIKCFTESYHQFAIWLRSVLTKLLSSVIKHLAVSPRYH